MLSGHQVRSKRENRQITLKKIIRTELSLGTASAVEEVLFFEQKGASHQFSTWRGALPWEAFHLSTKSAAHLGAIEGSN